MKAVVEKQRIVGKIVPASLIAMLNTVALNAEEDRIDEQLQIEEDNNYFQGRCLLCCSGFKSAFVIILMNICGNDVSISPCNASI